jgi:PhnB protein
MATTNRRPAEAGEAQVRRVIEDWSAAFRARDLERLWSHYAPEIRSFDLAPPLEHRSELRDELAAGFATWDGPLGFELRDLAVSASGDLAFAYGLARLRGKRSDGESTDLWYRVTVCLRRTAGRWKIVHEHASVPFYMDGSFKAAVDLEP